MNLEIITLITLYSYFNHLLLAAEVLHMLKEPGVGLSIPRRFEA
jgi:hypothetical protein